jgi:hypothetical protein
MARATICFPSRPANLDSSHFLLVSIRGLEPPTNTPSTYRVYQLRHMDIIMAGEARLERATNRFKVCYSTIKLLPKNT